MKKENKTMEKPKQATTNEVKKMKQGMSYTCKEKTIIMNVFKYFRTEHPDKCITELVRRTSKATGCSEKSIFQFRKEESRPEGFKEPSKTKIRKHLNINSRDIKYDESIRQAIKNIIYDLRYKNVSTSLSMILKVIGLDMSLPSFSIMTLRRLLMDMGFYYEKSGNKSVLMEKDDNVKKKDCKKFLEGKKVPVNNSDLKIRGNKELNVSGQNDLRTSGKNNFVTDVNNELKTGGNELGVINELKTATGNNNTRINTGGNDMRINPAHNKVICSGNSDLKTGLNSDMKVNNGKVGFNQANANSYNNQYNGFNQYEFPVHLGHDNHRHPIDFYHHQNHYNGGFLSNRMPPPPHMIQSPWVHPQAENILGLPQS